MYAIFSALAQIKLTVKQYEQIYVSTFKIHVGAFVLYFSPVGGDLEQQLNQTVQLNLSTVILNSSSPPTGLNRTVAWILLRQQRVRHDISFRMTYCTYAGETPSSPGTFYKLGGAICIFKLSLMLHCSCTLDDVNGFCKLHSTK